MTARLPIMAKIGVIFLTWRRHLQKDLVPHKITLKQQFILKQLTKKSFLYPSEIAEILFCDRPTASIVIKNLERSHWIKKEKDLENRRKIKIMITEEGRKKLTDLDRGRQSNMKKDLDPLNCFTDEEKLQLDLLLTKLWKQLKNE